jgi:hypothetical protein
MCGHRTWTDVPNDDSDQTAKMLETMAETPCPTCVILTQSLEHAFVEKSHA